jgi:hypothetical protein
VTARGDPSLANPLLNKGMAFSYTRGMFGPEVKKPSPYGGRYFLFIIKDNKISVYLIKQDGLF